MFKLHKTNGKQLWWCLQSLEFKPDIPAKSVKHLNLGVNMFDKPNKEASYIVIHFLFEKLNPTRVQEVFRHCWPVLDHKHGAEFRTVTLGWLQEIANEEGSAFPKVAASQLLSSSGPRFINLMLHLAKHVMLKTLQKLATDRKAVKSVIRGRVDQYTSDGQDLCIKIFTALRENKEWLSHQSSVGSLSEAGQPVFVRVLELLNEGLCLLNEEREKIAGATAHLCCQELQEQALHFSPAKENLKIIRRELFEEDAVDIKSSTQRLEEDWEKKGAECLKNKPMVTFLKEEPVLDFVSPMELLEQGYKIKPEEDDTKVYVEPEVHVEPELKKAQSLWKVPPCETPLTCPVKVQSPIQTPSPLQASHRKSLLSKRKSSVVKNKAQILDLECDNLASQVLGI